MASFEVPPPFDADSPGDCIIQSSEGHKFKVFKVVLSLASPVFRDMFQLPQPSDINTGGHHTEDGLPIISLSETSPVVVCLLKSIYPPSDQTYNGKVRLVGDVYEALLKYDVPVNRIEARLKWMYSETEDSPLRSSALDLYALAWRLGLRREVRAASRYASRTGGSADLLDPLVAGKLVEQAGSTNALLALLDLKREQDKSIQKMVETLRLPRDLCNIHKNLFESHPACDYDQEYVSANIKREISKVARGRLPSQVQNSDATCTVIFSPDKTYRAFEGVKEWGSCRGPGSGPPCFHIGNRERFNTLIGLISGFPGEISRFVLDAVTVSRRAPQSTVLTSSMQRLFGSVHAVNLTIGSPLKILSVDV